MIPMSLLGMLLILGGEPSEKPPQQPKPLHQEVVVTAARVAQPVGESAALVTVLDETDLNRTPGLTIDDQLRQIPGFSLFRRSSSLVAHPTTQGVSLRGIGPSGTSRSLVLFDGLPLNDPFGGWIYWNRIPRQSLQRIEVVRGASSQIYGSSALGGVIQLFSKPPQENRWEVAGQIGNKDSYDLDLFYSGRKGDWAYLFSTRLFDTDGYFLVAEEERGAVDVPARSEFQTLFGRVYYKDLHFGLNLYNEDRGNGTPLQVNSSTLLLLEGGVEKPDWQANFYVQTGVLESDFSRILPSRDREVLTSRQRFESTGMGGSFHWLAGSGWQVGTDWRLSRWEGHDQNLWGFFAQRLWTVHPRLDLWIGGRGDLWQNEDTQFSFNPKAGVLYRLSSQVTLRGSVYRGFRAPTLNELFRPFRVGNIVTDANPELDAERLWGGEGGLDFHPTGNLLVRFNAFHNSLRDPVSNVTLSVTPELIQRQRQNLGRATIRGVEAEVQWRLRPRWSLNGSYLLSDSRDERTGLRLPQVARNQASVGVDYQGPIGVSLRGRWVGPQFEDDLNEFRLGGFVLFDVQFRRPLNESLELFWAAENLLDRRFAAGRTPVETLGQPRLIQGGLRFSIR